MQTDSLLPPQHAYETRAPIHLKDGTIIPAGSQILVRWADSPAGVNLVRWSNPICDRELKLRGRTIGIAIAGQKPSDEELETWVFDSVCETPTGDDVEPDGHGPDGCPSWLLLLGMV